ncbi:penicillin-binding protein 2 [Candidatus Sumerlaeota bacterium]|nr:penicillin-binding protein 2 [Candidatus Sumerlaeota bacterium]
MSRFSPDIRIRQLFGARLRILIFVYLFILLVFIGRIGFWTLFHQRRYQELARSNFIHPQRLNAPRGRIFSRDGRLLAVNRITYSIGISPFGIDEKELKITLQYLDDIFSSDFDAREKEVLSLRPKWRSLPLARNLSLEETSPILERQWDLPGLRISSDFKRYYPAGSVFSHIIGYLGYVSPSQIAQYKDKGYERDDLVGKTGLEYVYEDLLRGVAGREIVQRDARGRYCKTLETEAAQPGRDIYLTLDLGLQKRADLVLQRRNGVIIVMNPQNGDILAMVSYPRYDNNRPGSLLDSGAPVCFLNKAIQENYIPASTMKMVTAMAGLDAGIPADTKYECRGLYYLPDWKRPFKCDLETGHGKIDLREALQYSCNIYFYISVQKIGGSSFLQWMLNFGYGTPTGIDLPFEVAGSLPIHTIDSMPPGNLLNLSIGQGLVSATPLQVLVSYSIFANGGKMIRPHLMQYHSDGEGERTYFTPQTDSLHLNPEHRKSVLEGLIAVVNSPDGTGNRAGFLKEWKVAGKTGTAERKESRDDAWFVCFAPYDEPEVAVLVFLEEAGFGGSNAAPLARDILEYYFQNRERLQ